MNLYIILINGIGLMFFIGAAIFGYQNHEKLKTASNLWLYFAASSIIAGIWIISLILKELNIYYKDVEPTLYFAVVFLFCLVSMTSLFDFIKLHSK